jgi:hypothetical protein
VSVGRTMGTGAGASSSFTEERRRISAWLPRASNWPLRGHVRSRSEPVTISPVSSDVTGLNEGADGSIHDGADADAGRICIGGADAD